MHTFNVEQIFDTDFLVEQNMKAPCTEDITAGVEQEPCQQVKRIDILDGGDNITQINLRK
jgi:hypothetical protein